MDLFYVKKISWVYLYFIVSGFSWKFVPSKYTRPPREFRVYGNEIRQTVLDNFLVPFETMKRDSKKTKLYQSKITKFWSTNK